MRLIDADALKEEFGDTNMDIYTDEVKEYIDEAPTIEPNLILPERMERGDIYEVGETIVVMNHDDYYDLLCKSWVPKRGEWITHDDEWGIDEECSVCKVHTLFKFDYCPHCGAKMGEREGE